MVNSSKCSLQFKKMLFLITHSRESDVINSDLPVGYYPNDEIMSRFIAAATGEHTYAHHLHGANHSSTKKDEGSFANN